MCLTKCVFINSVNQAKPIHAGTHRCHWNLQVITWYTPEIYVSMITSRSQSEFCTKWKLNEVRSLLFSFVIESTPCFTDSLQEHGKGRGTVKNSSQQRWEKTTGKHGPGSGGTRLLGEPITHCMHWIDFGVC